MTQLPWTTFRTANVQPKGTPIKNRLSETVPGQAMHPLEIMRRWVSGLPLDQVMRKLEYFQDEEIPNFHQMDISEKMDYIAENRAKIEDLNQTLERLNKEQISAAQASKLEQLKAQLAELEQLKAKNNE